MKDTMDDITCFKCETKLNDDDTVYCVVYCAECHRDVEEKLSDVEEKLNDVKDKLCDEEKLLDALKAMLDEFDLSVAAGRRTPAAQSLVGELRACIARFVRFSSM